MTYDLLPPTGTYWTDGALVTKRDLLVEHYQTCARCGAFINSPDRHEQWHRLVEQQGGDPA